MTKCNKPTKYIIKIENYGSDFIYKYDSLELLFKTGDIAKLDYNACDITDVLRDFKSFDEVLAIGLEDAYSYFEDVLYIKEPDNFELVVNSSGEKYYYDEDGNIDGTIYYGLWIYDLSKIEFSNMYDIDKKYIIDIEHNKILFDYNGKIYLIIVDVD